jgi:hypothetical protein
VGCTKTANNTPPDRVELLRPITAGSSYYEANYSEVWAFIATQAPFDNTCRCEELIDNGAGLSWNINVPAGGYVTYSHLTLFSPAGTIPTDVSLSGLDVTVAQSPYLVALLLAPVLVAGAALVLRRRRHA